MSLSFVHVGVCHHEICAQRGLLWYFIVVYYCGILLWYSVVVYYCGILLWYSIVVFCCGILLWYSLKCSGISQQNIVKRWEINKRCHKNTGDQSYILCYTAPRCSHLSITHILDCRHTIPSQFLGPTNTFYGNVRWISCEQLNPIYSDIIYSSVNV